MSVGEKQKSFCIESLLSRGVPTTPVPSENARAGGDSRPPHPRAFIDSPAPVSPSHSPSSSPHSSPSPAFPRNQFMGTGAHLRPAPLYQYHPGMGMPPSLIPGHSFSPSAAYLMDAHTFGALKSGAIAPAALDWFARAQMMYHRLPDLAGNQPHFFLSLLLLGSKLLNLRKPQ